MAESLIDLLLFPLVGQIIGLVVLLGSAIWVYRDAKRYKEAGVQMVSPGAWGVLVFMLWLIFFPLYLILKFAKYNRQKRSGV